MRKQEHSKKLERSWASGCQSGQDIIVAALRQRKHLTQGCGASPPRESSRGTRSLCDAHQSTYEDCWKSARYGTVLEVVERRHTRSRGGLKPPSLSPFLSLSGWKTEHASNVDSKEAAVCCEGEVTGWSSAFSVSLRDYVRTRSPI